MVPMKLVGLTLLALVAFAANSVLNRAALETFGMDPGAFTAIRLASGGAALALILRLGGKGQRASGSWMSAGALALYAVAFSFAYVWLPAGTGALILFGSVQITMFAGALISGERPAVLRWLGSVLGLSGLAVLFAPGATAPDAIGAVLMALAGMAWGVYSLRGKGSASPLADTTGNFLRCLPVAAVLAAVVSLQGAWAGGGGAGILLAVVSGALASGVGYALWYSVLPHMAASLAAVAQLSVPLIALLGGMIWLGEAPDMRFAIAAVLIIGGVLMAIRAARPPRKTLP